jgi:hypothetical protein
MPALAMLLARRLRRVSADFPAARAGTPLAQARRERGIALRTRNTGDPTMDNSKMKLAYVITTRNGKHFWNRVGVAFVNNDGSINVKLEAMPVSGEIQIRDYVPRDEASGTTLRGRPSNGHPEDDTLAELA